MALATAFELALPERFEALRLLGSGGVGTVLEVFDRERRERVALKTLRRPSPEALLQLKNEFRALQDIRHENLVGLRELLEHGGRFFVTMDLIEGCDLLEYVRPGTRHLALSGQSETQLVRRAAPSLPPPVEPPFAARTERGVLKLARLESAFGQLARGLAALHERGKVHRDVKPGNVVVTAEGRAVLVDFGLASDLTRDPTLREALGGTRAFMAPEQAAGQTVTSAADRYSLGVVLFLLLTGELPFYGSSLERRKLTGKLPNPRELAPEAPEDLSQLALALLAADPEARPSDARVLEVLGQKPRLEPLAPAATGAFVGRQRELSQLLSSISGSGSVASSAVIVGDSGLGKSALAREVLARFAATEPAALVLAGRCYERELLPYKALDGIVDALSQFLSRLASEDRAALLPANAGILTLVFPVLGCLPELDARGAPDEPLERRALAFAALRELLARVSRARRVVLYIDDLQWADADSHQLLRDLLRQPDAPCVSWIATARPWTGDGADPIRALMGELDDCVRLELAPLPSAEAEMLARAALGNAAESDLSELIARETLGHPLFVQALAAHALRRGGLSEGAPKLDDALLASVGSVAPEAQRLLDLTAIAGAPLPVAVAARASALDPKAFSDAVATLRAARLIRAGSGDAVGYLEPYHDRIRETLLERLDQAAQRSHHQSLVDALLSSESAAQDSQGLVRHLEGAGKIAEAARGAELAARQAEGALAFAQACELYGAALRLGAYSRSQRAQLSLRLAQAAANAGRGAQAAEAYLEAAAHAEPAQALELRRLAADHMLRSGHIERGTAILSEVLAALGEALPSQRLSLTRTLFERLRLRARGLHWQARAEPDVQPELLQRVDAYHAVGISLALIDPSRGGAFEARALRFALDAGEPLRVGATAVMEACYEAAVGARGIKRAERLSAVVDRVHALTGSDYVASARSIMRGFMFYHQGAFAEAAALLHTTERDLQSQPGTYFEQAFCHCFELICRKNRGEWGELQRGYFEWVRRAEQRGDRFTAASLRFNLSGVWLARDEPVAALRDLERVQWQPPQGGYHVQHWYEQQARAEIALYACEAREGLTQFRAQLRALAGSFILHMRLHRAHARWLLVRFLLASRDSSHGVRSEVESALRDLWAEDVGFARAWSLLGRAGLEHRAGQRPRAQRTLQRALEATAAAGLLQYEHAAAFRLGNLLGGQQGAALRERALSWARSQRLLRPERLFASWAPGFD